MRLTTRSLARSFWLLAITGLLLFPGTKSVWAKPSLTIIVPERDTLEIRAERVRLAGHTEPGNRVRLNGSPLRVYSTGAFIAMIDLQVGKNQVKIVASGTNGQQTNKILSITRLPDIKSLPSTPVQIAPTLCLPEDNCDLTYDQTLLLRFLGTPGGKAWFSIPGVADKCVMTEQPVEESEGLRGVYTGVYQPASGHEFSSQKVVFFLDVSGRRVQYNSPGSVSLMPDQWPRVAETTNELTALRVGLGQARLGGAELGYLPRGVRLELAGKRGEHYRVRLSNSKIAWVAQDDIRLLPLGTWVPRSLLGSATVDGAKDYDEVAFSLSERLPFLIDSIADSGEILLELAGATSNLTWITNTLKAKEVKAVSWHQREENLLQVRIALRNPYVWGVSAMYPDGTNTLTVRIKHAPSFAQAPASSLKGLVVAIDPGHGGRSRGALGSTGLEEKTVTLQASWKLKELLEARGASTVMTRSRDTASDLSDRVQKALDAQADFFISLHANSIGLTSDASLIRGTSTYFKYPFYRELSQVLYRNLLTLGLEPFGNIGSFNFHPLKRTEIPSTLIEIAFMSHPEDEKLLMQEQFQRKVAVAITDGLEAFCDRAREVCH